VPSDRPMRISTEPPEPAWRPPDAKRLAANMAASRSVAPNLREKVRDKGYAWGLFHGHYQCPIKEGVLRHWWMLGCSDGMSARKEARAQ